jgi:hypothetical protein
MTDPIRFWEAAFTSNEAFGLLWDEYMYYVVSHDDIQLVRGVVLDASTYRPELMDRFEASTGVNLNWASWTLLDYFRVLVEQEEGMFSLLTAESQSELLTQFRTWVSIFTNFAESNNVRPSPSVHDSIIVTHHMRYYEYRFTWN